MREYSERDRELRDDMLRVVVGVNDPVIVVLPSSTPCPIRPEPLMELALQEATNLTGTRVYVESIDNSIVLLDEKRLSYLTPIPWKDVVAKGQVLRVKEIEGIAEWGLMHTMRSGFKIDDCGCGTKCQR